MYVANYDPRIPVIERLLVQTNRSYRWLANQVGATHPSIGAWLSQSGNPPKDPEVYDRMIEVLQTKGMEEGKIIKAKRACLKMLPVYGSVFAGVPGSSDGEVEWEEVPDWGMQHYRWGRKVEGESMVEVLLPGDVAVFEDRRICSGDVVHAFRDDEDCIKCLRGDGAHQMLYSFNEEFRPFEVVGWTCKGVCVGRIRYGEFKSRSYTEFSSGLTWRMRQLSI